MLFAKRDIKDEMGRSFSERFAHHIGRFLPASDDAINQEESINIPLCYTLVDEKPKPNTEELDLLKLTIQKIIQKYHHKTGHWLDQEQVAFAVIWQDAKHQATLLKKRFNSQNITLTTLSNSSPLRSALIADALQVKQFISEETISSAPEQPCSFKRRLNLPLDDTNMAELETIGREVRMECEQQLIEKEKSLDDMEACWRLKLRYEGYTNSLTVKCMPIEMLRDVFEAQYRQKYGTTDENRVVLIDEIEIELRAHNVQPSSQNKASIYIEQWMSQWQRSDNCPTGVWLKQNNPIIQERFSWLKCTVLEDMLSKLVTKAADSTVPGFFMTNSQKDVDEVVIRN
jgi:hypothetical protein